MQDQVNPEDSDVPRRSIGRACARLLGVGAIGVVLLLHLIFCLLHGTGLMEILIVGAMFIGIPYTVAVISLFTRHPLRAVGCCALLAPWILCAIHVDHIRPYQGGGASLIYVAVLFYGTPSAALGFLPTGPVMRLLGITVRAG